MRLRPSLLLFALAACHGGSRGSSGATATPPPGLLAAAKTDARPIVFHHGAAYLWLHQIEPYGDTPEWAPEAPGCSEESSGCWNTIPAPAERVAPFGALPKTVSVITPEGVCQATVAPVVIVNTSGCEPSMTYAAPLTGCGAALAPLAFTSALDADLRWLPTPSVGSTAIPADLATVTDPLARTSVSEWLAGPLAGTRHEARMVTVSVDAGRESLTTIMAGALIGDGDDQCEWNTAEQSVTGLRRGDAITPLALTDDYGGTISQWDGAIAWRGQVVGVASGAPNSVRVDAVERSGRAEQLFSAHVWSDNEECSAGSWTGIEYPCGP